MVLAADAQVESEAAAGRPALTWTALTADTTAWVAPVGWSCHPGLRAVPDCRSAEAAGLSGAAARLCRMGAGADRLDELASLARLTCQAHSALRFSI